MTGCKLSRWNIQSLEVNFLRLSSYLYHTIRVCLCSCLNLLHLPCPIHQTHYLINFISKCAISVTSSEWTSFITSFHCVVGKDELVWFCWCVEESTIVDESNLIETYSLRHSHISCLICRFALKTCNIRHEHHCENLKFVLKGFNSKCSSKIFENKKDKHDHSSCSSSNLISLCPVSFANIT